MASFLRWMREKAWSALFATSIDGDGDKPFWR
jgi:hypothetical protein